MKLRFNNFDIQVAVKELQSLIGRRLNQVYDVDNKTFLFRLFERDSKTTLLIESGIRFHSTSFEWPKNNSPSGFTMKLRKHLKNKRLEKLEQIGSDRIVKFVFGADEYACNVILELYDRGNIILTDHENTILYILRPYIEGEDLRLVIREKYPETRGSLKNCNVSECELKEMLALETSKYDNIKGMLMCNIDCGPAVIDHALRLFGLDNCYISDNKVPIKSTKKNRNKQKNSGNDSNNRIFNSDEDFPKLMKCIEEIVRLTNEIVTTDKFEGYIFQKKEEKPSSNKDNIEYFYHNIEFHPYLFDQYKSMHFVKFASFMAAVDEFYSSLEAQKIDLKTIQLEKEALKKLSNVKLDHEKRLDNLAKAQEVDKYKADLITANLDLVDAAINGVRQLVANQMPWSEINLAIKAAQERGDPIASIITRLKLESNIITLALPSESNEADDNDDSFTQSTTAVDIDISNSAWANARKYYDQKKFSAQKEQKTIDASGKALKNAEKKTQQTLRDVRTISNIAKARKTFWFEKFYWFISSENYLVIGGRDAQQNELIVKRYMRTSDIYVHAEVQGASSVIIRNPSEGDVPPKTLLEAGTMAISYSVAWDAKVLTNAYWVRSDQVSKTAPTGEYLGTGSFMIRGKKNFLPPCQLIMGVSVLFKLEDGYVAKHAGERKVCKVNEDTIEDSNALSVNVSPKKLIIEKKIVANDEEDLDEKEMIDFPDTEVKVSHDTGCVTVLNKLNAPDDDSNNTAVVSAAISNDAEEATIVGSLPQKVKTQVRKAKKNPKEVRKGQKNSDQNSENKTEAAMKRGKRNKERRKNKYKDQDFEERDLRMQILKSSGNNGSLDDDKPNNGENDQDLDAETRNKLNKKKLNEMKVEQNLEEMKLSADVDMLETLTGIPFEDDELLFVIPVIAPYQALQNYKYKVKIIPGTGKRGTAAKTALSIFSQDKACTSREKDLFKSIQNEVLARNIPGKVKLMAPQLQKYK